MQKTFRNSILLIIASSCLINSITSYDCERTEFLGSPVSTIIKAYETIHNLLQVGNVDTKVWFLGSNASTDIEGGEFIEYIFRIDEGTTPVQKALVLQISTFAGETFVDQILYYPLATIATFDAVPGSGSFFDFADAANAVVYDGAFITTDSNIENCNILKENYSYFYEHQGDRFKKDLNN